MHVYLRDSVNLQNCDSYNSYKALLEKLKLVIKLKSLFTARNIIAYMRNKKQLLRTFYSLFIFFFNREHCYCRDSS